MEDAALNVIRPFLDARESVVGTAVDAQHSARATAEVTNVEGKRVDFKVSARSAAEPTSEL
jgi:fluoroacetyl-CoA thioesterase